MKVKLAEEKVSALKNELQSKEHELKKSKLDFSSQALHGDLFDLEAP